MKTIISAIKYWVTNEVQIDVNVATDDDILNLLIEQDYIDPISSTNESIYTNKNGEIYIL